MGRPNKIEQAGLLDKVLELAVHHGSREIAQILKRDYGLEVSHVSVHKLIKGIRKEQAERVKAVVQEHVSATLPRDLDILDEVIRKEKEWFDREDLKISEKLLVAKELRQAIDTKLKYSGAGEQEAQIVVKWADDDEPE
ncbi:MAG: hypothetical protein HPY55_16010 [Firmicutes bacterium]|nr:hypothetical protein [Bacillota bacterium]